MQPLQEERRRLNVIDGMLREEAPALASKFDIFTRLTLDDGQPPDERQFRVNDTWRYNRQRVRRCYYLVITLAVATLAIALTISFL